MSLSLSFISAYCILHNVFEHTVFCRILTPPQKDAPPPPKFLDHIPEVSGPKIYMTALFIDRFNAVLTICLLHPMK